MGGNCIVSCSSITASETKFLTFEQYKPNLELNGYGNPVIKCLFGNLKSIKLGGSSGVPIWLNPKLPKKLPAFKKIRTYEVGIS